MLRAGQPTDYAERLKISQLAQAGQSDAQIAQALQRSYWTCRKWRRRSRQGSAGLVSKLGRPAKGCLSAFPTALVESLGQLRQAHPGWGPQTLYRELATDPQWQTGHLPSPASIAAWLKATGLVKAYRHRPAAATRRPNEPTRPHQEWELDAQGETYQPGGVGHLALINVIDGFSRLKIESYPTHHSRQPKLADYQLALRRAFTQYGLPEAISFDHAGVFYDNSTDPPFPTRLCLWLIALGVAVHFIRKARPTDHAKVERNHQTLQAQALEGQLYSRSSEVWQALDQRRVRLNTVLPCRSLNWQAPLQAYPGSQHSGRFYQPELEEQILDLERVWSYLGQADQDWFRTIRPSGTTWIGGQEYYVDRRWAKQQVEVRFEVASRQLLFQLGEAAQVVKVPIKGLDKASLMGELSQLQALPSYQMALPFDGASWRQLEYVQQLLSPARLN